MADFQFGGGINEQDDANMSLEECVSGQNFKLDSVARTFRRRDPQDLLGTATNAGRINSIIQLIDRDDTVTTLVHAGNRVYSWNGSSTFTEVRSVSNSRLRDMSGEKEHYWSLDDYLIITDLDLSEPVYKWDGTTFSRLKFGITSGTTNAVAGITRSGSTATANRVGHGHTTGDLITIAGADQTEYNGEFEITVVDDDNYTYTVTGTPVTPATGTITEDVSPEISAKYCVIWNGRIWLHNIKVGAVKSPHMTLVSAFENAESFSQAANNRAETSGITESDPFWILTPDLKPINAATEFMDQVIVSTLHGSIYKFTGQDASDYKYDDFYKGSAAEGSGSIANIGNDVVYMRKGGIIESFRSTERFGDVATDDISRFIPNLVANLTEAVVVYDQSKQKVYFFVTDKVLMLDKKIYDNPNIPFSPWSKYVTAMTNNFNARGARYLRVPGSTNYSVYWGDSDGNIYDMNGTGTAGDAGSLKIVARRKSKQMMSGEIIDERQRLPNFRGGPLQGRVEYRRKGTDNLRMEFDWGEEYNTTHCICGLKDAIVADDTRFFGGSFYFGGDFYFNEGEIASDKVSTVGFSPVGRGHSVNIELILETTNDFLVNRIYI